MGQARKWAWSGHEYSGTSLNGLSEMRTTSLQRTHELALTNLPQKLIEQVPLVADTSKLWPMDNCQYCHSLLC